LDGINVQLLKKLDYTIEDLNRGGGRKNKTRKKEITPLTSYLQGQIPPFGKIIV